MLIAVDYLHDLKKKKKNIYLMKTAFSGDVKKWITKTPQPVKEFKSDEEWVWAHVRLDRECKSKPNK